MKAQIERTIEELKAGVESVTVTVSPDTLLPAARSLRDMPGAEFDVLDCLTAVDWRDRLQIVYHLLSTKTLRRLTLKVDVDRNTATVPSVVSVWKAANWHEREAYDLFGIAFDGHPDLRRILLPDDWEGHPLRKQTPEGDG